MDMNSPSSSSERFFIFTGKGGVGKTTVSLSYALYLKRQGKKVRYVYFEPGTSEDEYQKLDIDLYQLDLFESVEGYVGKKLNSKTLAQWITKTPFFKALINMIPGFSYLVYLGHLLQWMKDDPELYIVLDSPSSGHAITMFEATHNFREIFQSGLIFDDTTKMLEFLDSPGFMKIYITALPTLMAMHEALELQVALKKLGPFDIDIIINNSVAKMADINAGSLPDFLQQKLKMEQEVFEQFHDKIKSSLPHSTSLEYAKIVDDLSYQMGSI